MDLRDRLRMLKAAGLSRAQGGQASAAPPSPGAAAPTVPPNGLVGGCLQGYTTITASGETFFLETRHPIDYCHGPLPLSHVWSVPGNAWEILGHVPASVDLRRAVFFDTETTGLAGGSGTYAFLVGMGFFDGDEFVVRQYFLRDYPEESALLEAVAQTLSHFSLLVTFNGKSYDWPLMETRYRMSRSRAPLAGTPHLDLLHPARRIWKERLQHCNLTNLESQVLGVRRQGDIPGHLIPQRYFDYLRTGEAHQLVDVLEHNRLDILSLISLAGWLGHLAANPLHPTPDGEVVCGDDLFALGRLYEARGLLELGMACYEEVVARGTEHVSPARVLWALSQAYKRSRQYEKAINVWEKMIAQSAGSPLLPYIEMAKYFEHVSKDVDRAHALASQAMAVMERRRSLMGTATDTAKANRDSLQHRLTRLHRKMGGTP